MLADGVNTFVEVGPGATLTPLVDSILGDRSHLAVAVEPVGRSGIEGLLHTLARLATSGVPVRLDRLFFGRSPAPLDPTTFRRDPRRAGPSRVDLARQRQPRLGRSTARSRADSAWRGRTRCRLAALAALPSIV